MAFSLNAVALALFAWILTGDGVLVDEEALEAAGGGPTSWADRQVAAALLSAVVAGAVVTLFTWLSEAAESDVTRVLDREGEASLGPGAYSPLSRAPPPTSGRSAYAVRRL